MAPNQALIQFLSILPNSENEIEKRTFWNRLLHDWEKVLRAIRLRSEDLQRQRKRGREWKDVGHAFVGEVSGGSEGKRHSLTGICDCPKQRGGCGWGGHSKQDKKEDDGVHAKAGSGEAGSSKVNGANCKRCGESHKFVRCPDQIYNVYEGKGNVSEIYSANVTALVCVDRRRCKVNSSAEVSSEDAKAFVCDTSGKLSGVLSEDSDEGDYRELPRQLADIPGICNGGTSCHMSFSSTVTFNYRELNASMQTVSGERWPIEGYDNRQPSIKALGERGGR